MWCPMYAAKGGADIFSAYSRANWFTRLEGVRRVSGVVVGRSSGQSPLLLLLFFQEESACTGKWGTGERR